MYVHYKCIFIINYHPIDPGRPYITTYTEFVTFSLLHFMFTSKLSFLNFDHLYLKIIQEFILFNQSKIPWYFIAIKVYKYNKKIQTKENITKCNIILQADIGRGHSIMTNDKWIGYDQGQELLPWLYVYCEMRWQNDKTHTRLIVQSWKTQKYRVSLIT